jgi:hypothetical protein
VTARDVLRFDVDVPASTDVREPYSRTRPTPVPNAHLQQLRRALAGDRRCDDVRVTSFLSLDPASQKIAIWVRPREPTNVEDARSAVRTAVRAVIPDARIVPD